MSAVLFDVLVDATDVVQHLEAMGNVRMGAIFDVVAEDLATAVVDRIDSRGDGDWAPNAPSTIARKGSDAPMIDTGQLRSSIRGESGNDFAMASTSVAYIVYSLDGGQHIPKRNPFELRDEVFEEAARYVAEAVADEMSRVG